MRGRLFARNPAAWLLALLTLCRAPGPARRDDLLTFDVDAISGRAEIAGLP